MVEVTLVSDDERLYRSVRPRHGEYENVDGKVRLTWQAFKDKSKKPSVDRACMVDFNPERSKLGDDQGIVTLVAGAVRGIADVRTSLSADEVKTTPHRVDVKHDPVAEDVAAGIRANPAHAVIVLNPELFGSNSKQKDVFKRLQLSLARLVNDTGQGWTIAPKE